MANVSPALQWSVIRKSSRFVFKRDGRTFTTEPNNLRSVNSFRYNGLVQEKTVGVEATSDGKGVVVTTRNKKRNKPSKNLNTMTLKKNGSRRAFKSIMGSLKGRGYRKDLQTAALRRASTILNIQRKLAAIKRQQS